MDPMGHIWIFLGVWWNFVSFTQRWFQRFVFFFNREMIQFDSCLFNLGWNCRMHSCKTKCRRRENPRLFATLQQSWQFKSDHCGVHCGDKPLIFQGPVFHFRSSRGSARTAGLSAYAFKQRLHPLCGGLLWYFCLTSCSRALVHFLYCEQVLTLVGHYER